MIVNLNGHTGILVDVTNWLNYPGEWPVGMLEEIDGGDLDVLNDILDSHQKGEGYLDYHVQVALKYPWFCEMMGIGEE
jgi:hypothetical protein